MMLVVLIDIASFSPVREAFGGGGVFPTEDLTLLASPSSLEPVGM